MTTKRKTQLKRAAISWLCVAALVGGSVPAGLPGIIPTVTAAAEDTQTIVSTINLGNLVEYVTNPQNCPTGITASYGKNNNGDTYNSIIELKITQSGTYKLTGSNLIGDAYFDVKIIAAEGIGNVNIVCENAFIRNDEGSYEYLSTYNADTYYYCYNRYGEGTLVTAADFVVPFKAEKDAAITLSGTLAVDTFSIHNAWNREWGSYGYNYIVPVSEGDGTVNTDAFSVVTYTDNNGGVIDKGYYLSAGKNNTYSADLDKISITSCKQNNDQFLGDIEKKPLSEMYQCFGINGMKFNPASITGNVTVECSETHTTDDGICDKDGYNFVIDLDKLGDYADGNTALPEIITAEISDNSVTLTIKESGTYKLTGANTTDVKIYAAYGVTADIVCDNAYIKNTNGSYSIIEDGGDEYAPSLSLEASGYICPFGTNYTGKINLSGKLVVDTYSVFDITWNDDYPIGDFIAKVAEGSSTVTGVFTEIDSYTNGKKDQAFYLNGAVYDASDYAGDHLCISVRGNDVGDYTFTAGTDSISFISYNDDHGFVGDSDVCKDCGDEFTRYNVTFEDGSESPDTVRVIENRTVSAPEIDPTAPVGKKFAGWYSDAECTTKYDFANSVTGNITLYAGWEALPVQSVAVKTAPSKTSYIEGEVFDPTGLVITLTYDNGNTEDITYSDSTKGGFTFAPDEFSLNNAKVTITYGGKSVEQAVTVTNKSLSSIAVKAASSKTSYIEGEKFDPTGLVITLTYNNGKTEDVTYNDSTKGGFTFAPDELSLNNAKVTITYGGKSAQQEISVAEKSLTSIAVKTAPRKTSYIEGEKFDPTGLVITLTYDNGKTEDVAYSDSTKDGFTFAPETFAVGDKKVTITYGGKSVEQAVKVSSKSSGGSSGGGSSSTTTPTTTNPSIGGSSKSWSDVAADLGKLTSDSEATIELNGNTTVPVDVIKAIADNDSKVTFVTNSVFSWGVDGADITAPAAADLTFVKISSTKSDSLRGIEGTQFKINDTGIPTSLEISFRAAHAGKFANLYKSVDSKLTFVTCAKLGEDGKVILPDVVEKGDYVVMLCEFSDRPGDMDNDGVMKVKDATAILKDIVGLEPGKNRLMADFNGDGKLNAMDASAILKRIVGLA